MTFLAQIPDVSWTNALFAYGPLGIMCAFLMFFSVKKLDTVAGHIVSKFETVSSEIVSELRVMGHRFNGLSRALFAEALTRERNAAVVELADERRAHADDVAALRAHAARLAGERDGAGPTA